jgi:MFS family permease
MSGVVATIRGNFSPLKESNFRTYLIGQAISLIGTWLQVTALGWVVWKLTNSNSALGISNMFATLPLLILSPWTGAWADRFDRRKILMLTQAGAMSLAFILAFLVQTNLVQIWHVYVLSLCLGIVNALDFPTQQAFLGDLAGIGEVRKAVNLNITFLQVSRILGPAVAGFLIGSLGVAPAFWLNGLSFLAVIYTLYIVRANQVRAKRSEHGDKSSGTFMEAVRFIIRQPRMIDLIIFAVFTTFFGLSIILNLLPSVADKVLHGDANTLGFITAASGAGALVGVTFLTPVVQSMRRTGLLLSLSTIWMGFWFFMFSTTSNLIVAMFFMFMASLAPPTIMTTCNGLLQIMSPPLMRARLLSLFVMVSFGMQPVAALLVGYSGDHLGIDTTIAINGVGMILGGAFMLLRPRLRTWESTVRSSATVTPTPVVEGI